MDKLKHILPDIKALVMLSFFFLFANRAVAVLWLLQNTVSRFNSHGILEVPLGGGKKEKGIEHNIEYVF